MKVDNRKNVHISYADGENRVAYLTNVKGEFQRLTWTNIPRSTPEACILATVAKSSF
jgi:preprotein translocase subunit SecE